MQKKQYVTLFILVLLSLVLGGVYPRLFSLDSNVLNSLSRQYFNENSTQAYQIYEKRKHQDLAVLLKTKKELSAAIFEIKKIYTDLYSLGTIQKVDFSTREDEIHSMGQYYLKYRRNILSLADIELTSKGKASLIYDQTIEEIYSPFSAVFTDIQEDPLLLMNRFFKGIYRPSRLTPIHGLYYSKNKEGIELLSNFKIREGKGSLVYEYLKKKNSEDFFVFFSSVVFYSEEARESAFKESNLFSIVSFVLILLIFGIFFKSFKHLLVSGMGIIICSLVGLYGTSFLFGGVHIISLLLGISIVGLMIDYFIHYFVKEYDARRPSGVDAFFLIRKPLLWGLLTSLFGFFVFFLAPLSILKQFSCFCIITLIMSFLYVRFVLPHFFSFKKIEQSVGSSLNERILSSIKVRNIQVGIFLVLMLGIFALKGNLFLNNDIRSFSQVNPMLKKNETEIIQSLGLNLLPQYFIVNGRTEQELLKQEEMLREKLRFYGVKGSYISQWIPSLKKQKESIKASLALKPFEEKLLKQLSIKRKLTTHTSDEKYILRKNWMNQFSGHYTLDQWIGKVDDSFFSVVPIYNVSEKKDLKKLNSSHVIFMDKVGFINDDVQSFSQSIVYGIGLFCFLFFIFFSFRFGVISAWAIICPALFGIVGGIEIASLLFDGINLFHLLGCILVLTLGLDYSFFYYFNRKDSFLVGKSINISTLTTLSSFGILSMSSTSAVASFGTVVFVGIIFCWLLSPLSFLIGEENA